MDRKIVLSHSSILPSPSYQTFRLPYGSENAKTIMKNKSFTPIIYKEEDMYIAECPEVGTVDQGETIEEAMKRGSISVMQ